MPDLTIHPMQQCRSSRNHSVSMKGSETTPYTVMSGDENVPAHCTCKSFKYHGKGSYDFHGESIASPCKHILKLWKERCGWHQLSGVAQTEQQRLDMECPRCGRLTEWVQVAV